MPRFDVTTIGEGQLRLSVPVGKRLEQITQLDVSVAGTEANVTGLLSRLGWSCGWVSSLPKGPLGRRVAREYSIAGLDVSAVAWRDTGRLATYYVEYAVPPRSTTVIYDRKNSCFATLTVDDIDWDYLLDTRLLHLSGITIALSASMREIQLEAIRRAKAKGVKISFDMNYRSLLWAPEAAAIGVKPVFEAVDVLFLARGDARRMFGFEGTPQEIVEQIAPLTNAQYIVTSLGDEGLIGWDRVQFTHQPAREVGIIDRIGAGDAMVGGVLHGWLQNDFAKGIRYGVLTAALALSQWGEQIVTSSEEVETLLDSTNSDISR
ncbi:MAG: 2-dehydro-3-deoxygluconokinase [Anaerolineae bacterium]|nr:2-dehydro-3-deoxygluconokinase [Anaerolineae bacterium]